MEKLIKIENGQFWTNNDNILHCKFTNTNPNIKLTANKAKLYIDAINMICNGKPMPFLIDFTDSKGAFTTEAANLLANSESIIKLRICEAYIVNSFNIKLLINSYKRIYDKITPYEIFNDENTAIEYCKMTNRKVYGSY